MYPKAPSKGRGLSAIATSASIMFHVKHFQLAVGNKQLAIFLPTTYCLLSPFHVKHDICEITSYTKGPFLRKGQARL